MEDERKGQERKGNSRQPRAQLEVERDVLVPLPLMLAGPLCMGHRAEGTEATSEVTCLLRERTAWGPGNESSEQTLLSNRLITEDKEGGLFTVTLFRKVIDDFKTKAKENK